MVSSLAAQRPCGLLKRDHQGAGKGHSHQPYGSERHSPVKASTHPRRLESGSARPRVRQLETRSEPRGTGQSGELAI